MQYDCTVKCPGGHCVHSITAVSAFARIKNFGLKLKPALDATVSCKSRLNLLRLKKYNDRYRLFVGELKSGQKSKFGHLLTRFYTYYKVESVEL